MDRKAQYKHNKHKVDSIESIRSKNRTDDVAIRKEKKEKLLSTKRYRTRSGDFADDEISEEEVIVAANGLKKNGPHRKENLMSLRRAFSLGTAYIDAFFSIENALGALVGLYTGNDVDIQIEAAWCITNISAGTRDHAMAVTKQAAPYMVTYLSSSIPQLQDQSAWALGNLAADSQECKEIIRAQGIVNPLIQLLQSPHPKVVHSAAFALANLAKGSIEIAQEMIQNNVISNLLPHFKYSTENEAILSEVSWVFTYLAASGNFTEPLISSGVLTQIVALLVQMSNVKPHVATVVTPLLRCLGNICSGPDDNTMKACENADLLPSLAVYLSSDLRHARKETLWVLSNMTGDLSVCKAVTYGPHLSLILQQVPAAFDVKIEALYLLCNIACHGEDLCNHMVENGVLETVVPCLKLSDVEILNLSLALCEMCLRMSTGAKQHFDKQCEGIARLEALEYHNNDTLRKQAIHVLETYFEKEDETGKE